MASTTAIPKRVVVIGAGWAGLVAAKTYLEIDPSIHLTIFDSERTLGGVWSADRCFSGFVADSPSGMFDFSDLPMRDVPSVGLKDWSDLPSIKVFEYLKAYSEKFSLIEHMRLSTKVTNVARNVDGKAWDVKVMSEGRGEGGKEEVVTCNKLIIAAGLNSKPNWPDVPRKDYNGMVIHAKDVGLRRQDLIAEKVKQVTVYGGCKSAVDAIIMCLMAGKKVDWVIRAEGNGPGMMGVTRKGGVHLGRLAGRWKNILTPSIFATSGFWYRFLHSGNSGLGNWIFKTLWRKASTAPFTMEPYKTGGENIRKLMPETGNTLFFTAGPWAFAPSEGSKKFFRELNTGNMITVHRASITSMSGSTVTLSNDVVLSSDAAVFATGWDYNSMLFSPSDAIELGTTAPLQEQSPETAAYWESLAVEADKEVLAKLPILANPPEHFEREVNHTPYRLYRHILPSSLAAKGDHSLIFLGLLTSIATSFYSEISALWGVAWMEGLLNPSKTKEEMDYEIAVVNKWCERRYLGRGRSRQIASAEIQDVMDLLMEDMGLNVLRKGNFLSETFVPPRPQDYRGIVRELLDKNQKKTNLQMKVR